jgi:hypothetical protein
MKSDRLRLRGFFAALASDPYRKLIAIVLAVGLWIFINRQISGETTRTLSLTFDGTMRSTEGNTLNRLLVVLPTDRVIGRRFMDGDTEIQTAQVTLSGPRFAIESLRKQDTQLDLQITNFTGLDWTSRRDIEFTAADIRRDIRSLQDVEKIELDPPRIRLEVERLEEWPLPLSLDYVTLDVADEDLKRLRLDTAEFQPPTARILGPASAIARYRQPGDKPLLARIRRVGSERQVSVGLELVAGKDLGLRLAETPTVTLQVLPVTQVFTLELPLIIDDLGLDASQRGYYKADQATRRVRIRAGGQLKAKLITLDGDARRQEWASANLRLQVIVSRPEAGSPLRPEIVLDARLLLLETSQLTVDRSECALDEAVAVTLRRTT